MAPKPRPPHEIKVPTTAIGIPEGKGGSVSPSAHTKWLEQRLKDPEFKAAFDNTLNAIEVVDSAVRELEAECDDMRAWGDNMQSEASRLAEWVRECGLIPTYEAHMAL